MPSTASLAAATLVLINAASGRSTSQGSISQSKKSTAGDAGRFRGGHSSRSYELEIGFQHAGLEPCLSELAGDEPKKADQPIRLERADPASRSSNYRRSVLGAKKLIDVVSREKCADWT